MDHELEDWTPNHSYTFGSGSTVTNKIHHLLHTQHPLTLQIKPERSRTDYATRNSVISDFYCFVCDGCLYVSFKIAYVCKDCNEFRCCLECGSSTASRMPVERWENNKKSIFHYSHLHQLTRCRYKPRHNCYQTKQNCSICELPLWGICYGCTSCIHFIHESCVDSPQQITHPSHPSHPLKRLDYTDPTRFDISNCIACKQRFFQHSAPFYCEDCYGFHLHLNCADTLLRAIQHECHPHGLLSSRMSYSASLESKCGICTQHFTNSNNVLCYRCTQCDMNFHLNCVPIPLSIKHKYHLHALTLVDWFNDGEPYCNICETERSPYEKAYCCRDCKFAAHVGCVLSEEDISLKILSCLSLAVAYIKPPLPSNNTREQIRHLSHKHELSLLDATTEIPRRLYCKMCHLEICDHPAYTCQPCEFWAHKRCIDLPEDLSHPLHPHWPLKLFANYSKFACRLCRDVSDSLRYFCRGNRCGFLIDVKCAFETQDTFIDRYLAFETELDHPVHGRLILVNPTRKLYDTMVCILCRGEILGLICYSCPQLSVFFHESCLQLPLKVEQHPLHPHLPLFLRRENYSNCEACGYFILYLGYGHNSFRLHIGCALTFSRFLKHKIHDEHSLYYFHKHPISGYGLDLSSEPSRHVCTICSGYTKAFYYRCIECQMNFHLKCLRLPRIVKHKWHMHPLVYKESVGFGGFYCDICEEKRDLQHPVYCCEDCKMVVHVDCLVSQENASNVVIEEIED